MSFFETQCISYLAIQYLSCFTSVESIVWWIFAAHHYDNTAYYAVVVCKVNCIVDINEILKVTSRCVHCESVTMSETVQE